MPQLRDPRNIEPSATNQRSDAEMSKSAERSEPPAGSDRGGSKDGKSPFFDRSQWTPAIELPKGGGAIRGMGEKFSPSPFTGSGSFAVPVALSPGRQGSGPALQLQYSSGGNNSPYGFG